jgi:hypothetical protein
MREILYRGKRVDGGEWVYGFYTQQIGRGIDGCQNETVHFIQDKFGTQLVIPETVGQQTGLPHNIFEDDIIRPKNSTAKFVVVWNEYNCCYSALTNSEFETTDELSRLNILSNKGNIDRAWLVKYDIFPIGTIHDGV